MAHPRQIVRAISWKFSGEASRYVVEVYEDASDAVTFPLGYLFFAGTFGYTSSMLGTSGLYLTLLSLVTFLLALVCVQHAIITMWATKVYFTERTAEPMIPEVSR